MSKMPLQCPPFALGKCFALRRQVPLGYNIPVRSGAEGEKGRGGGGYDDEICGGYLHVALRPSSRGRVSYLPA